MSRRYVFSALHQKRTVSALPLWELWDLTLDIVAQAYER